MTEQTKQPEAAEIRVPIVLSLPEIQGILTGLRKFPMEQVESLVMNIQNQANTVLQQMQDKEKSKDEPKDTNETGETK